MISLENNLKETWLIGQTTRDNYVQACKDAVSSDIFFDNFKKDPRYTEILEHSGYKYMGDVFFNEINTKYPHLLGVYENFKKNDLYGNPEKYTWDGLETSPGTLRYVKTLGEIEKKIGNLNGMNVVEIGGGYGGQCLVLSQYFDMKSYKIYDLEEAGLLAKKYLNKFNIELEIGDLYKDCGEVDLVISNYAFSECSANIQDEYIEKVIKKSKHGFVTINAFMPSLERNNDVLIKMFGELFGQVECQRENYQHPNYVITW